MLVDLSDTNMVEQQGLSGNKQYLEFSKSLNMEGTVDARC